MTFVGALALSAFLILGILSSKKSGCFDLYSETTPEPTSNPAYVSANEIHSVFGGDMICGGGVWLLNFKSKADGCGTAVRIYEKSGVQCLEIVRSLGVLSTTPEPTDMFSDDKTIGGARYYVANRERIAEELKEILSAVYKTGDYSAFTDRIDEALSAYTDCKTLKTTFLFGLYIVKTELDGSNKLFTVVIEPA